jgi:L-arabinose transport system ATP-binding protein
MLLRFSSISKGFPGVQALDSVTFEARSGSVHALCGENGAGKSTLLKILSGVYQADAGSMTLDDEPLRFNQPVEALKAGVAVIYQELHLVPEMTVAENILLGHLPNSGGLTKNREIARKTKEILDLVGIEISPWKKVGSLSLAQRQMVEIGKALSRDARVIAFDEPTSSLSSREVETLFRIIGELKKQGRIIFYVTHRMDEIQRICDACTVLRDGKHVETFESLEGVTPNLIVQRMVGRSIEDIWGYRTRPAGEPALTVTDISGPGLASPQSLEIKAGEIVGIFGLVGAGRTELLKAIYKATGSKGAISVGGAAAAFQSPGGAIRSGIVLCPEDRKKEGIVPLRSVQENVNLSARRNHAFARFMINDRWEKSNAQSQVDRLRVRTPKLSQPIMFLSGGNQQKAILGRWLSENVKVLMLDEPTRGIDVGAKSEIYEIIYNLAESGVAVLFVSSELPEVLGVSDRILVMREGALVAELSRDEATEEKVLQLALPVGKAA